MLFIQFSEFIMIMAVGLTVSKIGRGKRRRWRVQATMI